MSYYEADFESDNFSPPPTHTEYQTAFQEFFNGIVDGRIAPIIEAGRIISQRQTPFAKAFEQNARLIEAAYIDPSDQGAKQRMVMAVKDCLVAYVYSAIEIEPQLVEDTLKTLEKNKDWLFNFIKPTPTLVDEKMKSASKAEAARYRYYGRRALVALGMANFVTKFLANRYQNEAMSVVPTDHHQGA